MLERMEECISPFVEQCHHRSFLQGDLLDEGVTTTTSSDCEEPLPSSGTSLFSHSEIIKFVKMQESARQNTERVVRHLESRVRLLERSALMKEILTNCLERSESMRRTSSCVIRDDVTGQEKDFTRNCFSCTYVSPILDGKTGNTVSQTTEDVRLQNQSFNRRQDDETEMEIKKLKAALQKREMQVKLLQSKLQHFRLDMDKERNILFDKVNTVHESQLLLHDHSISSRNYGYAKGNAMQAAVENICNRIKTHGCMGTDVIKNNRGAIGDELFISRRTLNGLSETCKGCDLCSNSCDSYAEASKLGNTQRPIDGIMQEALQNEAKIIALELSCLEKDKRLEELEGWIQCLMKEVEAAVREKCKLDTIIWEMCKEAQEQKYCIEELLNINGKLSEFSQAQEQQIRDVMEETQGFHAQFKEEFLTLIQKLSGQQSMLKHMSDNEEMLWSKHEILKLKLACTEFELAQCELSLQRLTSCNLEVDGYDKLSDWTANNTFISELVKGHEHNYCNELSRLGRNKERSSVVLLSKAQKCVDELEEKFHCLDTEISKYIREMSLMFQSIS